MSSIATEAISQKSFTFDQVKSEVLTRINDPLGDTYSDRAKELIYEGICSLALGGYSRDGYPLIAKTESYNVSESGHPIQISGSSSVLSSQVLKIISIVDEQAVSGALGVQTYKFIPIGLDEYNRLFDQDEYPFADEIFYYREGDFIKLYPVGRVGDVGSILINYIASPNNYGDSDVMTNGYSLDFLYKVVDYSVGRIMQEQGRE
tara:strand:+ start:1339 stop:1953 length:615 start_codon:yes stop_codon:yes gene_type:complete